MICPNCGSDNPPARSVCSVCGAELRPAGVEVLDPSEPQMDDRTAFENSLWPPVTVFALDEAGDEVLELPAVPIGQFEDAQADDVFEQSLSGVKLEDLIAEEEGEEEATVDVEPSRPAAEAVPADSAPDLYVQPESINEAEPRSHPRFLGPPEPDLHEVTAIETAAVPALEEEAGEALPAATPEPKRRTALKVLAGIAAVTLAFAGGAAAGFWYAVENTPQPAAVLEVPPPDQVKPAIPQVPAGMVHIPGGELMMGSDEGDEFSRPAHSVTLSPFFIDRTEVTNEAYLKFIEATGYDPPATWKGGAVAPGEEELPVTGVTWYDAAAFAAWAGKRLPTEAEWEYAARGAEGRRYPWGDEWDASYANVGNTSKGLRAVGQGRPTPLDVFDMAGNAWEWTASDARSYPGGKEFPWSRLRLKIIRGGNFKSDSRSASATFRGYYGASGEKDYGSTSFRCVKDVQQ